ncbi:uncharacterized protein L201_006201 [Kwoniella dendrophila CBS 6074]|uniref:Uncharacterized protein n=1 Tax=Kwoniella dendrophila CBS 6074 TaxID=1295534 RepID=A0AAX4K3E4_9TREE
MSSNTKLYANLPVSQPPSEIRGHNLVVETASPPFLITLTPPKKSRILSYLRDEQSYRLPFLPLWNNRLYFTEFSDQLDNGQCVTITRIDLSKAWLGVVDYLKFHSGLQYELVKRWHANFDFRGEDVETLFNDLSIVRAVFQPIFFELDRAMGLFRKSELKGHIPLKWYKPSVEFEDKELSDYPFKLKEDTLIEHLTPAFIHATKLALKVTYDRSTPKVDEDEESEINQLKRRVDGRSIFLSLKTHD